MKAATTKTLVPRECTSQIEYDRFRTKAPVGADASCLYSATNCTVAHDLCNMSPPPRRSNSQGNIAREARLGELAYEAPEELDRLGVLLGPRALHHLVLVGEDDHLKT
eukprot:3658403-Pleurochrysis_carterae.AAC.1